MIQLQPNRAPGLRLPEIKRVVTSLTRANSAARGVHVSRGYDRGGTYINISLETGSPRQLWHTIHAKVLGDFAIGSDIARAAIITFHDELGWLLLYHYDARERTRVRNLPHGVER